MKKIDISTPKYPNTFALVDDKDFEVLNVCKWSAKLTKGAIYAHRMIRVKGKRKMLQMHVAIMGQIDGKEVDHRNGNKLDNQRHNLRHCTHAHNVMNSRIRSNNSSGYKGASWSKGCNKWIAYIRHNGKQIHLGLFTCLVKAAKAYDKAAIEHFGEYAKLNFPQSKLAEGCLPLGIINDEL
jgi:hypothetical protein